MCWEFLCVTTLYLEIDKIEYGKFGRYKDFILNNLDYLKYGLGSRGLIGQHEQDIWPWWIKYKDISFHCLHAKKDNFTFSWWMCCVGVDWISTCLWQVTNLQAHNLGVHCCQKNSSTLVGPKEKLLLVRIPPSLRGTLIDNPHLQNSYPFLFAIFFYKNNLDKAWQSEAW